MENHKNYYEVLEVPISASQQEIYSGYVRVKHAYTGDSLAMYSLMTERDCKRIIEEIEQAYSVLSVPEKRAEYNKVRGIGSTHIQSTKYENTYQAAEEPRESYRSRLENSNIFQQEETRRYRQQQEEEKSQFRIQDKEASVSKIQAVNRFRLEYQKDNDFEQVIENTTEFTGEFLKKIREYKCVDIPRLADLTKISKTYLTNIENENLQNLPALAYVRGFVYQYAKCLKLNPDLVATSYINRIKLTQNKT